MFSNAPAISYGKTSPILATEEPKINYVDVIRSIEDVSEIPLIELNEDFEAFGETCPKLFPYQSLVVKAMMDLEQKGRMQYLENDALVTVDSCFGILADKLGSGKTYSILAVIKYAKSLPNKREFNNNFRSNMRRTVISNALKPTLFFVITAVFKERIKQMELFGLKYKTIQSANDLNNLYNLVVCGNKLEEFDVILFNTSILTSNKIPEKFRHKIRDTDTSINKFAIMFKGYNWNRIVIDDIDDFEKKALELARIIPAKFTWIISATVDRFYQKYHYEKIHRSNKLYYSLNLGAPIMRLFTIKCNDKFIEEQNDMPFIKAYLHSMNANTSRDKLDLLDALRHFYNFYQIYKFSSIPRILFDNFSQGYYNINSLYEISQTDSILSVLSIVFFLYQKIIDKMQSMLEIISKCKTTNAVIKKSTYGIDVLNSLNSLLKSLDDSTFMTKLYTFDMQKIEEDTKADMKNITKYMEELQSSKICTTHCFDIHNCNKNHESDCEFISFPEIVAVENAPYKFLLDGKEITKLDNGKCHTLQNILRRIIFDNEKGKLIELATNVSEKLFCGTHDCGYPTNRSFLIYVEDTNLRSVVETILSDLGKSHVRNSAHVSKSAKIQADFRERKIDVVLFYGSKSVSGMEFQTASDIIFIGAYQNKGFIAGKMAQMLGRCVRIGNCYNTQMHIIASKS